MKISASDYQYFEKTSGNEAIFYKLTEGKISNIICEAGSQDIANNAVEKFLLFSPGQIAPMIG